MKKLTTTIDDISDDIYISKDTIKLKNKEYSIMNQNGNYQIIDKEGVNTNIDDVIDLGNNIVRIELHGYTIDVLIEDPLVNAVSGIDELDLNIVAPLAGSISSILVKEGQEVDLGDVIMIISAMKMENKIIAKFSGVIKCININEGDQVSKGAVLIELEKL
ncbi:MAG: acetyl-CoA carboxylase biotin carboxyl carrier protein subunit [Candidatus Heimdallarchaeota archaeon]|nr:acetyl-CoA carboxylase biotin carboxyl carrier protein subunit [Candidatus Heimdallarchaeota archaeon]